MRRLTRLAVPIVAASLAAGPWAPAGGAGRATLPCAAKALTGSFRAVPDSAGAGNIVYALRLRNRSHATCFVSGIPGLALLDRHGRKLPTHPLPSRPGELTAVLVRLAPGKSARATARFSPDVPGVSEPVLAPCEPTATALRVAPAGGGALIAPITPPTPVCEHGTMTLSVLTAA